MDIRSLKYFIEIVRMGSFTRAAGTLYISQPMLTKAIQQLEHELGIPLIDRSNKYFRLTDAGQVLYQGATDVCMRFDDLRRQLLDVQSLNTGKVEMAIPSVLLNTFFADMLRAFRQEYPDIQMHITETGSKVAARLVLAGEQDVGFVMLPVKDAASFSVHCVAADQCVAVFSKQHALAGRQMIHISELEHERMVLFNDQFTLYDMVIDACEKAGFQPKIIHTSSLEDFIVRMVTFNEGITIMPRPLMQKQMNSDIVMVPMEPAIPWEVAFITHRERYLSFAAKALVEYSLHNFQLDVIRQ